MTWHPKVPADARKGDRAVSDVLGYAVVFGIVLLSIGLIYTVGVSALGNLQHGHAMDNAERAFDIVSDNMADIHRNDAPGRGTELQFASGQLSLSGGTTIIVENETAIGGDPLYTVAAGTPLSYTSRETGLHYVGGAVLRTHRQQGIIVKEPPFAFGKQRTLISLVETNPAGASRSVGGDGSIHMTARNEGSRIVRIVDQQVTFSLTVRSSRYEAWERYFQRQQSSCNTASVDTNAATDEVTFTCNTDELRIRRTAISLRLTT